MSVDYSDSHIRKRAKEFYLEVSKAGNKWVFTEACYNLWGTSVVRYGNCEAIQTINEYGMWLRDIAIELAEIKIKNGELPIADHARLEGPHGIHVSLFLDLTPEDIRQYINMRPLVSKDLDSS